jgi:hypothetical protein
VRGPVVIALVLVTGASVGIAAPAKPPSWPQIASGLRPALDTRSSNPCQRGDFSCLGAIIAEMSRRDAVQSTSCDHRAVFPRLYLRTTQALLAAAEAGRFRHRAKIVHFAAWFARYHFQAEDEWTAGRRSAVPGAWQVAFSAAAARSVRGLGDLLLGMNAHITRDLAFTVAELERGPGTPVDPDFAAFTEVIEAHAGSILAELAARFDPGISAVLPIAIDGRRTMAALIGEWRMEAWRNGIALRDARGGAHAAEAQRIESLAVLRADTIVAATAYLPVVESSRTRDAYCAAHGHH